MKRVFAHEIMFHRMVKHIITLKSKHELCIEEGYCKISIPAVDRDGDIVGFLVSETQPNNSEVYLDLFDYCYSTYSDLK